jgi:hypothetical protein
MTRVLYSSNICLSRTLVICERSDAWSVTAAIGFDVLTADCQLSTQFQPFGQWQNGAKNRQSAPDPKAEIVANPLCCPKLLSVIPTNEKPNQLHQWDYSGCKLHVTE